MKWGLFWFTTVIAALILWFEWPRMKNKPNKDKVTLWVLLLLGWALSGLDLLHMTGPTAWIFALFRPLGRFMEH